jgi:hypothetical protein
VAGNRLEFNDGFATDFFDNSKYQLKNNKVELIS